MCLVIIFLSPFKGLDYPKLPALVLPSLVLDQVATIVI